MAHPKFDLKALCDALDEQRRSRELSWAAVRREVNRFQTEGHPIATSTITGLKEKAVGDGDVGWLGQPAATFTRAAQGGGRPGPGG